MHCLDIHIELDDDEATAQQQKEAILALLTANRTQFNEADYEFHDGEFNTKDEGQV